MDEAKLSQALGSFLSGYIRRMLEAHYDKLVETDLGQTITHLPLSTRYGIEAGLYGLLALLDIVMKDDSLLRKVAKDVISDAPSEISKRIINGAKSSSGRMEGYDKEDVAIVLRSFLALKEEDRETILLWASSGEPRNQRAILTYLATLGPEELAQFAGLSDLDKDTLEALVFRPEPSPDTSDLEIFLESIRERVRRRLEKRKSQLRGTQ
ncbi:MAG: hypothetical protein IT365_09045 [Candidatus Hydrogenedentes bacterium]|nr:hypothetical protein [Candidatus Hydrogenedentota bacterium]